MAHGEEIRITRTWTNSSGKPILIRDMEDHELESGIVNLIKSACREEYYQKGGKQKFKNSWQSYVERAYWDFCQACFVRGIDIEKLIKETSDSMYKELDENPPKKKDKKPRGLSGQMIHSWGTDTSSGWAPASWNDNVPVVDPYEAPPDMVEAPVEGTIQGNSLQEFMQEISPQVEAAPTPAEIEELSYWESLHHEIG